MLQNQIVKTAIAGAIAKIVYTCPTGRRATVVGYTAANVSGLTLAAAAGIRHSGVYAATGPNLPLAISAASSVAPAALILEPGDTLEVATDRAVFRVGQGDTLNDTNVYPLGAGAVVTAIVYLNGKYIAYGSKTGSALIATSTTGLAGSWTIQTTTFNGTISDVAYGNGVYVFTLLDSTQYLTSTDLVTITTRTHAHGVQFSTVAYGAGVWVMAGASGKLVTATDPTGTFVSNASATTAASSNGINHIIYDSVLALWVAGVTTTAVITATDPTGTWTVRATAVGVVALATNGGRILAKDASTNLWSSTTGTGTWALVAYPTMAANSYTKRSLVYANSKFVLASSVPGGNAVAYGVIAVSANGITFTNGLVTVTTSAASSSFGYSSASINGVAACFPNYCPGGYGAAGWVFPGANGSISEAIPDWTMDYCRGADFTASIVETY